MESMHFLYFYISMSTPNINGPKRLSDDSASTTSDDAGSSCLVSLQTDQTSPEIVSPLPYSSQRPRFYIFSLIFYPKSVF